MFLKFVIVFSFHPQEIAQNLSSIIETPIEALDPYIQSIKSDEGATPHRKSPSSPKRALTPQGGVLQSGTKADEGLFTAPQIRPCRVDKCGAAVPRRYP